MRSLKATRVIVIGAGIGGLTAAAVLTRQGFDVTVLEAHIYPGGCAGTFYFQGYRFDAGATLAGGFSPGGPMELVADAIGIQAWPARTSRDAMVVHLPAISGAEPVAVVRKVEGDRLDAYRNVFGPKVDTFWRWQEITADLVWDLALRLPAWPPQSVAQAGRLVKTGLGWGFDAGGPIRKYRNRIAGLFADAFRPVAYHLRGYPEQFRLFIDAQLLISAQTTSRYANALYGAAALDLPRRGVVHLEGGMGSIAQTIAKTIKNNGGKIYYRQEVQRIHYQEGRAIEIFTKRGETYQADIVIVNLPPANIVKLVGEPVAQRWARDSLLPKDGWGAFMVYVGLDGGILPKDFPLHHQVIVSQDTGQRFLMGEGNTLFLSLSPEWDAQRAPAGCRALTISTHTTLQEWWDLFESDPEAYEARKNSYTERMLEAAEIAIPGLRRAIKLVLPGTPITFEHFTRRIRGWVGGFPQTSLFRAMGPKLAPGLWMVGDSIFPGQSAPAVALGGLRVAHEIQREKNNPRV